MLLIGLTSLATVAQRTVTGTVSDADGFGLPGASVVLQGTTTGTISDIDGKYSLTIPSDGGVLVYSFIGFETIEMPVTDAKTMNVTLRDDSAVLDEIVVVGYGTMQQKEVTSAVATLKTEEFNQGFINNPLGQLQGKVAGVSISQAGSDPNGTPEVRLRGLSTLGANTQPLIVIDGVIGGSLETIDPNDIASFDVLKDGSATAIYGIQASSGVILITTKKGSAGATKVEYNGQVTTESIAKTVETMDAEEFKTFRPDTDRGTTTNWIDEITRDAISNVHNVALSGGVGNNGSYRASFNYRDVQGVGITSGFKQLNGRLSMTQKAMNDRLTLTMNMAATNRDAEYGFNEAFRYATVYNPTAPTRFSEGDDDFETFGGYYQEVNFDFFNPLAILEQGINRGTNKDLLVSGKAAFEIVDNLTISAQYSKQVENDASNKYYNKLAYFRGTNANGLASKFFKDKTNDLFETTLNYDLDLDSGLDIGFLAGYSYQRFTENELFAENSRFVSDAFTYNSLQDGLDLLNGLATINSKAGAYEIEGLFGRVTLNFNDFFYVNGSLRLDGTSRNAPGDFRRALFPGISAGVDLGQMLDADALNSLKLRAGYGITGTLPSQNNLFRDLFTQQSYFPINGTFIAAYGPNRNANPSLTFERKSELNVGLDFAVANYLITGSVDYYSRTIDDFLFEIGVPVPPNQAPRTWANLDDAQLISSGIEAALDFNFKNNNSNMSWKPTLVLATNNSRIARKEVSGDILFPFFENDEAQFFDNLASPGAPGLNDNPIVVVEPDEDIGNFWGKVYEGVSESGQFVFSDINGDGVVNDDDKQIVGNGLPNLTLGLTNTFQFGDFDFSFFIRGDFGHDMVNMYRLFYEPLGDGSRTIENIVKTQYFDETLTANPEFSSHYVEDADYVALDNATLGYTLDVSDNPFFSRARIYVTGNRLFFLTDYSGVDPSPIYSDPGASDNGGSPSREFNASPLAPGLDRRNRYFRTRAFTLGVNLAF